MTICECPQCGLRVAVGDLDGLDIDDVCPRCAHFTFSQFREVAADGKIQESLSPLALAIQRARGNPSDDIEGSIRLGNKIIAGLRKGTSGDLK